MSIFIQRNSFLASIAAVTLLALALPIAALAASASKEISTATEHAGYAAKAGSVGKVHLHLHHVVNCLVGKNGKGFDKSAGDPCAGQGSGAIDDLGSGMAKQKKTLKKVVKVAETGIHKSSMDAARKKASKAHKMLKSAQ